MGEKSHYGSLSGNVLTLYEKENAQADKSGNVQHVKAADKSENAQADKSDSIKVIEKTPKRNKVSVFSLDSQRRLLKFSREIPKDRYKTFLTLTYPATINPKESKEHLNQMLEFMRREAESDDFGALWVVEYQQRGVLHYHVWSTHYINKDKLQAVWNRLIKAPSDTPSTNVKSWRAYSRNGLGVYASKCVGNKSGQKNAPECESVGRWWGCQITLFLPRRV